MKKISCLLLLLFAFNSNSEPFDITYAQLDGLFTSFSGETETTYTDNLGSFVRLYTVDDYARYVNDLEDWFDYMEFKQDRRYVEELNEDLTDSRAHAIVDSVKFGVDLDEDGIKDRVYRHGDIIEGSDWNNNGLIDCLEVSTILVHSPGAIGLY